MENKKDTIIDQNSDFLFVYEATQCNPNGDPDQENKPRMDYDTQTNLVTDTRVKRYIRDFLKNEGRSIFVDLEGNSKVSPDTKLKIVLKRTLENRDMLEKAFADKPEYLAILDKEHEEAEGNIDKVLNTIASKGYTNKQVNYHLLAFLVKEQFLDIRMFGSAFAVAGFTKAYTGPIQLNWGYSLNKVELVESSSIVTTMNDDSSTFGKDYRLHYSLLAFNGTVNKHAARSTGLTEGDLEDFRSAIWQSIPSLPTRSKMNQYPKLYVELKYNKGFTNGQFGDLRNYVEAKEKNGLGAGKARKFSDLNVDISKLKKLIAENQGNDKSIAEVIIKTAPDFPFD